MAGIGVKLNRLYEKNTLITTLSGISYSMIITIAPMIIGMLMIWAMSFVLGFSDLDYARRELFSCTVLYIFIFALVVTASLNAVISRYMADVIFQERYGEIMACFYYCLLLIVVIAILPMVPFFLHEYRVGGVDGVFIFLSFFSCIALVLTFYCMTYLSICKDYAKISLFYLIGLGIGFLLAWALHDWFSVDTIYAMLSGLGVGFLFTAALEYAQLLSYFRDNSHNYTAVNAHFRKYWKLIIANTAYILGLYCHNFVFWTTDLRMEVVHTFVCAQPFDMATFLGLLTNITATTIFISSVERRFTFRYRKYSEMVIGGRLSDIEAAQKRLFRQLSVELMGLVRTQFIISVVLYLVFVVVLPQLGISGMVMQIYPCMAVGYYILFLMYAALNFLYYFNDLNGALMVALGFLFTDVAVSIVATGWQEIWYGMGLVAGAFVGWTIGYLRLRWVEKNLERHIFCEAHLLNRAKGARPSDMVYERKKA
ncbi:MAG: exopolysaccharide Pel transporter PelG [Lachnospiraceae bacterium]|nr:exopolysaccharide Pel transporter PelG [Lachnospiraceae bacterium]